MVSTSSREGSDASVVEQSFESMCKGDGDMKSILENIEGERGLGLSFTNSFSFAVTGCLIKGLTRRSTRQATMSLFSLLVDTSVSLSPPGEKPDTLGFIAAMLPTSTHDLLSGHQDHSLEGVDDQHVSVVSDIGVDKRHRLSHRTSSRKLTTKSSSLQFVTDAGAGGAAERTGNGAVSGKRRSAIMMLDNSRGSMDKVSTGLPALIQAEHRLAEDDTCGILFLSVLLAYLRGNVEPQGASLDQDRSVIYALLQDLIEALPKVFLPVTTYCFLSFSRI